jgi:hypothetical protein
MTDIELYGWHIISGESNAGFDVSHIVPANDLREHTLNSVCWCEPELDEIDFLVIHKSADKREYYETKNRQSN